MVSQAIKTAFSPENLAVFLESSRAPQAVFPVSPQGSSGALDDAVSAEVVDLIQDNSSGTDKGGVSSPVVSSDLRPKTTFTSISVPLSARVSSKLKAKIFANEYVDFGALLSSSPHNEGKYSLSMSPAVGSVIHPQLTLEPLHNSKRIQSIHQWVSAFTIFVSVYSEKFKAETSQLMKYCDVVRDLAHKGGDWIWYDEQFRYLRQSAPEQYPWDQTHWELWLRASSSFRKAQPSTNKPVVQNRSRFRSQFFPKGTCWAFQAGKHCSGCEFKHECFKCGAQHPGSQCSAPQPRTPFKGARGGTQTQGSSQSTSNASKRGSS